MSFTEHKPLRLSRSVGMQVGLVNWEDTVEYTHYEAMFWRVRSKLQDVKGWEKVARSFSFTNCSCNYHLYGMDRIDISGKYIIFVGASTFQKDILASCIKLKKFSVEKVLFSLKSLLKKYHRLWSFK